MNLIEKTILNELYPAFAIVNTNILKYETKLFYTLGFVLSKVFKEEEPELPPLKSKYDLSGPIDQDDFEWDAASYFKIPPGRRLGEDYYEYDSHNYIQNCSPNSFRFGGYHEEVLDE